jgi:hypothetical protein
MNAIIHEEPTRGAQTMREIRILFLEHPSPRLHVKVSSGVERAE